MIKSLITILLLSNLPEAKTPKLPNGMREVQASSCEIVRVNLSVGMTTQLVFEEVPVQTLHADEEHFKVRSSPDAPRSIAVIPSISSQTLAEAAARGQDPMGKAFMDSIDRAFSTNLFVFFKNSNQLVFQLRFVPKSQADNIVKVRQVFKRDCNL